LEPRKLEFLSLCEPCDVERGAVRGSAGESGEVAAGHGLQRVDAGGVRKRTEKEHFNSFSLGAWIIGLPEVEFPDPWKLAILLVCKSHDAEQWAVAPGGVVRWLQAMGFNELAQVCVQNFSAFTLDTRIIRSPEASTFGIPRASKNGREAVSVGNA
jgi:hypothetical protein